MGQTEALAPEGYDTIFFCLAHYRYWRSRLEWLLNKIRNMPDDSGMIPKKYLLRVPKLVCTCGEGFTPSTPHEDPWANVTPDDHRAGLQYVKNFIEEKINNPHASIFKRFLSLLDKAFLIGETAEENEAEYPTSSAMKLMYLLKKASEKDFEIFEPPARLNLEYEPKKMDMKLSFDLEGFNQDFVDSLFEEDGSRRLKPFQKQHKCEVKLVKIPDEDGFKVVATVTKNTGEQDSLGRVKQELIQALKIQQDEFAKAKIQPERGTVVTSVPDLPSVETSEDLETDPKSSDTREEGPSASSAPQSVIQSINLVTSSLFPLGEGASASSAPQAVTQSTQVTSSLLAPDSGSVSGPIRGQQISNKITTLKMTRLSEEKSVACIVHNRKWTSTFQYVVTNCCSDWNKLKLPRNKRQKFCQKICTCFQEATLISLDEKTAEVRRQFDEVKQDISQWPAETLIVTRALVKQLDKPEVWPSLYKFVVYYNLLMQGNKDCLDDDFVPPEIHDLQTGSAGGGAARTRHRSNDSVGSGSSFHSASDSSSPVNTASANLSQASAPNTSRSAPDVKKAETPKPPILKPYKLKRVAPQEWSADCFFHGPKRKCVFQCVLNHLHDVVHFPVGLNIPFSRAVCVCGEPTIFGEYYASQKDSFVDCRFMRTKLAAWKGEKKASIQPLMKQLDELVTGNQSISDGFVRFVFHFRQAHEHKLHRFMEIKQAMVPSK